MIRWEDNTHEGSALRRRIGFDEVEKKIVTETEQPGIDEVLRLNQAFLNADRPSSSLWGGNAWVRVASIPLYVVEDLMAKGLSFFDRNDLPRIKRLLNSLEYEKLRTAPGRL